MGRQKGRAITELATQTISDGTIEVANGKTTMTWKELKDSPTMLALGTSAQNSIIFASGSGRSFSYHGSTKGTANAGGCDPTTGAAGGISVTNPWKTALITAHALFMIAGWGFLLPLGVIIAHFGRNVQPPGWWFRQHRMIQTMGLLCGIIGLILAFVMVSDAGAAHMSRAHHYVGLIVMIISCCLVPSSCQLCFSRT